MYTKFLMGSAFALPWVPEFLTPSVGTAGPRTPARFERVSAGSARCGGSGGGAGRMPCPWRAGGKGGRAGPGRAAERCVSPRVGPRRGRAELGAHHARQVFLMGETAVDGHVGDGQDRGAQHPARVVQPQLQQELVRRLSGAGPELPTELARTQPGGRGQIGDAQWVGDVLLHQLPCGHELLRGQPRHRAGRGRGPTGRVRVGELGGEHADEVIDVGARGGLPLPHDAVQSQHDLLDQGIRAAQFLGEFDRLTAAVRLLEGRVAEIEVDGVEAPWSSTSSARPAGWTKSPLPGSAGPASTGRTGGGRSPGH